MFHPISLQPIVLNCSHTFCQWCIDTWLTVNEECPICREGVMTKTYCLDLDYYIKKMIELGPIEEKDSYKLLEETRILEGPKGDVLYYNYCYYEL